MSRRITHPRDAATPSAKTAGELVAHEAAHRAACDAHKRQGDTSVISCRVCAFYAAHLAYLERRRWTPAKPTQGDLRGFRRRPQTPARVKAWARTGVSWTEVLYREGLPFRQALDMARAWQEQEGGAREWPGKRRARRVGQAAGR